MLIATDSLYQESHLYSMNEFLPSLQHRNVPFKLVSMTAFQPLEDMLETGHINWPPPLFTRKSIFP